MSFQDTIRANVLTVRSFAAQFLTGTALLRRKTGDTVVDGENIATYASPGETIACRLIVRSGSSSSNIAAQERLTAQSQYTGLYKMQLPFGVNVRENDHIVFTDTDNGTVRTFEVIFAPPYNEMTGAYVVGLEEVK